MRISIRNSMSQIKITMLLVVLLQLLGLQFPVLAATVSRDELVKIPPQYAMKYRLDGKGLQKYMCKQDSTRQLSWHLYSVSAKLSTQDTHMVIGNHFLIHDQTTPTGVKPVWEIEGKRIFGLKKDDATAKTANSIPWLKLEASGGSGIQLVLRTETQGGLVKGECPRENLTTNRKYSAIYTFYGSKSK